MTVGKVNEKGFKKSTFKMTVLKGDQKIKFLLSNSQLQENTGTGNSVH